MFLKKIPDFVQKPLFLPDLCHFPKILQTLTDHVANLLKDKIFGPFL